MKTGVLDKNGVEIQEYDIVTFTNAGKKLKYFVKFGLGCFWLYHYKGLKELTLIGLMQMKVGDSPLRWGPIYRAIELGFTIEILPEKYEES